MSEENEKKESSTDKILIARADRFVPAKEKPLTPYQKKVREQQERKREQRLARLAQSAPYPTDARETALQKTMNLGLTTPVKKTEQLRGDIFTPGEYNPLSHDLVEMPPTPQVVSVPKQLTFDDDNIDFGLDFKEEDEFKEIGGRKKRRTTHKSKKSKKTRKSRRKTTRKVRRHRRH